MIMIQSNNALYHQCNLARLLCYIPDQIQTAPLLYKMQSMPPMAAQSTAVKRSGEIRGSGGVSFLLRRRRRMTGRDVREACRAGVLRGTTAGLGAGLIQANLIVLPAQYSKDFFDLCVRNPVACPLLAKSAAPGKADEFTTTVLNGMMTLGNGQIDVRSDLPMYVVYDKGRVVAEKADILEHWGEDHVAFFDWLLVLL